MLSPEELALLAAAEEPPAAGRLEAWVARPGLGWQRRPDLDELVSILPPDFQQEPYRDPSRVAEPVGHVTD